MNLVDTLATAGMTPPQQFVLGRWTRFPGCGKGRSNRAGWCRLITPALAIYGDWSTGLSDVWHEDGSPRDDIESRRLLREAKARFAAEQQAQQARAAQEAQILVRTALLSTHPYLARKGFPEMEGLVGRGKLLVPVRDSRDYGQILSVQEITPDGVKRFLTDSRTRGGIHRIGAPLERARRVVLCEGYATALSLDAALQRLPGPYTVVACFSAYNLQLVSEGFPQGVVCADNDASKTGELAARETGLNWTMPPDVGTDFNDLHQRRGILAVTQALRVAFEAAGAYREAF